MTDEATAGDALDATGATMPAIPDDELIVTGLALFRTVDPDGASSVRIAQPHDIDFVTRRGLFEIALDMEREYLRDGCD